MKKIISIIVFVLLTISCEKDDICTTPNADTAHLVIRFYDNSNQDTPKEVTDLLVIGILDNGDLISDGIVSTRDSIAIPLRTIQNNTSFILKKDYAINDSGTPNDTSDDTVEGIEDVIILNYENEELFISKACGFKNIFNNVIFDFDTDGDDWIIGANVVNTKIENQDNAHIHIFH